MVTIVVNVVLCGLDALTINLLDRICDVSVLVLVPSFLREVPFRVEWELLSFKSTINLRNSWFLFVHCN